jgi:REase_DpnII-MboI
MSKSGNFKMTSTFQPHALVADIADQISAGWTSVSKLQSLMHFFNGDYDLYNEEHDLTELQFRSELERLYISICALLESLNLISLLVQFKSDYAELAKKSITSLEFIPFVGEMHSEVLGLFWKYHSTLSALLGEDTSKQIQEEQRQFFEGILNNTPKIVKDRGIEPSNEAEVRKCVYDLLIHVFPDAVRESSIIQNTKTYKPDLGVKSLKVAAEYKFADSEQEVKAAIGGLYEDMRGYSGSNDWTYFYAVVYMTDAFFTQQQIMAEFKHTKADANWKPILVIGKGSRKSRTTAK